MPSELKPTTWEERERWKLHCAIYQDRPYTPGREEFIQRLIADVERLSWRPFTSIKDSPPKGWLLALAHGNPRTGRFQTTEDGFLVFWVTDGFDMPAAAVSHICEIPDYSPEVLNAK